MGEDAATPGKRRCRILCCHGRSSQRRKCSRILHEQIEMVYSYMLYVAQLSLFLVFFCSCCIICPAPREACGVGGEREGWDFLLFTKGLRAAALSIGGASAAAEQQSGGSAGLVAPRHLAAQPGPVRGAVAEGLRSQQEKYCRHCREKRKVMIFRFI